MARIDRQRLATATFPLTATIQTRFDDLDLQGHVNNAAGVVLLQEARVALNRAAGLPLTVADDGGMPLRAMVASLTVEYAGELHHPAPVEIATGILALGRTSLTIAQVVRQDGEARLFAQVVMVIADAAGPTPLPAPLRAAYERLVLT